MVNFAIYELYLKKPLKLVYNLNWLFVIIYEFPNYLMLLLDIF